VEYLANTYKWLSWLNNLPETVISLLAGLVPAALLSALSSFVPKIFRGDMDHYLLLLILWLTYCSYL
jgi:hypothetical protein